MLCINSSSVIGAKDFRMENKLTLQHSGRPLERTAMPVFGLPRKLFGKSQKARSN